jgi:TolB-like protein
MSEDKDAGYFADGVHEDLLTQLALLGNLKVVSRVSVMDYRNTKKNSRQIGSELGVVALVEGSVRRAGNQVRVTAQLIDARLDKHLWAKSYDRELKDIFAIQSELASEIAKSLRVSLEPEQQTQLAKPPTQNLEAYDLLLRHQLLAHETAASIRFTSQVNERAALLVKAVSLDPGFALAWARLAVDHARAYRATDKTPARLERAREAFARAQALAPDDAMVKIEAGTYYRLALNDLGRSANAYEQVLAVAPYNVEALIGLSLVRSRQMNFADSVALLERALAVDPRNPDTLSELSDVYRDFRQYERSLTLQRQLTDIRPADDELKANFHETEYLRTGSWNRYDEWRRTLHADTASRIDAVKGMDIDRAIARGDFNEALRLIDVDAEDARNIQQSRCACKEVPRVLILRAKGDHAAAAKAARSAMQLAESELKKTPDDIAELGAKASLHAIFGEREKAFAALAQAVAVQIGEGNLCAAAQVQKRSASLYALLGERKAAIAEVAQQLHFHSSHVHDLRLQLDLVTLWNDPEFKALMDDPMNNAPISFQMKCS